jgi:tetratricopeptide (TPR) repeat protein
MRVSLILALILVAPIAAHAAANPAPKAPSSLDALFASLAKAQSEDDAKPIETQILALFDQSGSPSVDLLMARAGTAADAGDKDTAKKLIDAITDIAPDYAEGWHRRAALLAAAGDDEGAMISLQKAVTLNPREFAALSELAGILEEYGDKKAALVTYRKALALDPHLEGVDKHVDQLSREVEGEKI